MRPPGVPGERRGSETRLQIREVSRVQSGDLLLQGARRAAPGRAREPVRRADSYVRLPNVQEASGSQNQVSAVQGGGVL
jgi:hypothetical protein